MAPGKNKNTNTTTRPFCGYCKKPGHDENKCFKKNPSLKPAAPPAKKATPTQRPVQRPAQQPAQQPARQRPARQNNFPSGNWEDGEVVKPDLFANGDYQVDTGPNVDPQTLRDTGTAPIIFNEQSTEFRRWTPSHKAHFIIPPGYIPVEAGTAGSKKGHTLQSIANAVEFFDSLPGVDQDRLQSKNRNWSGTIRSRNVEPEDDDDLVGSDDEFADCAPYSRKQEEEADLEFLGDTAVDAVLLEAYRAKFNNDERLLGLQLDKTGDRPIEYAPLGASEKRKWAGNKIGRALMRLREENRRYEIENIKSWAKQEAREGATKL